MLINFWKQDWPCLIVRCWSCTERFQTSLLGENNLRTSAQGKLFTKVRIDKHIKNINNNVKMKHICRLPIADIFQTKKRRKRQVWEKLNFNQTQNLSDDNSLGHGLNISALTYLPDKRIFLVWLLGDLNDRWLFVRNNFHLKADEEDEDDYYYDVWDEDDYSDNYDEQNKRPVTRIDYKK